MLFLQIYNQFNPGKKSESICQLEAAIFFCKIRFIYFVPVSSLQNIANVNAFKVGRTELKRQPLQAAH